MGTPVYCYFGKAITSNIDVLFLMEDSERIMVTEENEGQQLSCTELEDQAEVAPE